MLGGQRGLLGLILFRHLLGVTARGLRVLELFVLDGEEFGAERFNLLLGRGPHVGRGDDSAEPPRGGDRLQAGNADTHHEHFGCRNRACRGHHHRESAAEGLGCLDHGAIAGEIGLAGQHIHHLRAGDARHQFHRKCQNAGLGQRLQRGLVAVGIHDRNDQGAALVAGKLGCLRAFHLDDDVGIFEGIGADGCADGGEFRIQQPRFDARAGLDREIDAQRLEFFYRVRRRRDPRLGRIDFLGDGNLHEASGGARHPRANKLASFTLSWIPVLRPG